MATKDWGDAPTTIPPPRVHRQSFADEARERVERAVRNGLIVRDEATGLATVVHPEPPAQLDSYSPEHFDALEQHRAQVAEAADVAWLLEHPAAQLAALRTLDVELSDVARKDAISAIELVRDLALCSVGHAPPRVLERAMPIIRREARATYEDDYQPWMSALPVAILAVSTLRDCTVATQEGERTTAELVLDILDASVTEVPREFQRRKAEHLRAAERFLATTRIANTGGDQQPHSSRRGPAITPWRAASEFARRFGITSMPIYPREPLRKTE